jgi:hypothetical protein
MNGISSALETKPGTSLDVVTSVERVVQVSHHTAPSHNDMESHLFHRQQRMLVHGQAFLGMFEELILAQLISTTLSDLTL